MVKDKSQKEPVVKASRKAAARDGAVGMHPKDFQAEVRAIEKSEGPLLAQLMAIAPDLLLSGKLDKPIFGSDTALTLACCRHDPEAVEFALGLGADPKATTQYGQSAIMQALHKDAESPEDWERARECMRLALEAGCDLAHRNQVGQQAINWASWRGKNVEAARWLLAQGANPSSACSSGMTPLHDVARMGHVEMAKLFLSAGAASDLFKKADHGGKKQDPLQLAIEWLPVHRNLELVALYADASATQLLTQEAQAEAKALKKEVPRKRSAPKPKSRL